MLRDNSSYSTRREYPEGLRGRCTWSRLEAGLDAARLPPAVNRIPKFSLALKPRWTSWVCLASLKSPFNFYPILCIYSVGRLLRNCAHSGASSIINHTPVHEGGASVRAPSPAATEVFSNLAPSSHQLLPHGPDHLHRPQKPILRWLQSGI